jgi:hypothetical protein
MGALHDEEEAPEAAAMDPFLGVVVSKKLLMKLRSDAWSDDAPGIWKHHHHGRRWGFTRNRTDGGEHASSSRGAKYTGD